MGNEVLDQLGPRILIIGCSGSGKSTLAFKLEKLTGLPVVHLDRLFWKAGWVMSDCAEFDHRLDLELSNDFWIMDGNFDQSLPRRLGRATDVLAFEYSRWFCIYRVLKRIIMSYGRTRPDMTVGCPERFDWEFIKWIWNFPEDVWKNTCSLLDRYPSKVRIRYFRTPREVEQFLESLSWYTASSIVK